MENIGALQVINSNQHLAVIHRQLILVVLSSIKVIVC